MKCLVDEAHGTHLYFGENMPVSAMAAGADMAAVSMHKSGGSLTQSSVLLTGPSMHEGYVRQIINLTQTTSASYLLLSSLDISRRNLALRGRQAFSEVVKLAEYARKEINSIGGYYAYSRELINGDSVFDFDVTKLSIYTYGIGLAGIEVYDLLRDEYDIQTEFGDLGNLLAYVSIGDRKQEIERLVGALAEVKRRFQKKGTWMQVPEYLSPHVVVTPRDAFYALKESLPIAETKGRVCSEFVMCYPPGIPILAPGEEITEDILKYLGAHKRRNQFLCGFSMETEHVIENSRKKLEKKNLDMIVANNLKTAGAGFGTDTNVITIITKDSEQAFDLMSKAQAADCILDAICKQKNQNPFLTDAMECRLHSNSVR